MVTEISGFLMTSLTRLFQNGWVDPAFGNLSIFCPKWSLVTHAENDVSYCHPFPSLALNNLNVQCNSFINSKNDYWHQSNALALCCNVGKVSKYGITFLATSKENVYIPLYIVCSTPLVYPHPPKPPSNWLALKQTQTISPRPIVSCTPQSPASKVFCWQLIAPVKPVIDFPWPYLSLSNILIKSKKKEYTNIE